MQSNTPIKIYNVIPKTYLSKFIEYNVTNYDSNNEYQIKKVQKLIDKIKTIELSKIDQIINIGYSHSYKLFVTINFINLSVVFTFGISRDISSNPYKSYIPTQFKILKSNINITIIQDNIGDINKSDKICNYFKLLFLYDINNTI